MRAVSSVDIAQLLLKHLGLLLISLDLFTKSLDVLSLSVTLAHQLVELLLLVTATSDIVHEGAAATAVPWSLKINALERATIHHTQLALLLFERVLRRAQLRVELPDRITQVSNLCNQLDVVIHDVQMLFLVDVTLTLQSLLERVHRVVEVLLLILVFLLYVGVDLHILHLLVFYVFEQTVIYCALQLIVVVRVRYHEVNCVLKALDVGVILTNALAMLLDDVDHLFLTGSKVINDIAEVSIDVVELLQRPVHVVRAVSQRTDFSFSRLDFKLKLLDFVVQHKLELFELLRLLLQLVDLVFFLSDHVVFLMDVVQLFLQLLLQLLDDSFLSLELSLLVGDLTLKLVNL